jgi:glycosyltransferase involved in cell wall biosynthesis
MCRSDMQVALIADWLVTYAGAEKVLKELITIYPESTLFSVIDYLSNEDRAKLGNKEAITTYIQKFPGARRKYQKYLPFMPMAIEQLDVSKFNVIISSSHAVAKGVLTGPDQLHISYVHSPLRYAWDLQHQYLKETGLGKGIKGTIAKYLLHKMRIWDLRTANGVDHFIANSNFIARRIKKVYGREADVIYPPVDISRFTLNEDKSNYYLTASRMVPYKKMNIIVEAFASMPDKKLVVIGDGSEMAKIKSKATSNVEILGYQKDEVLTLHMQKAKAFIFAAEEDFGISPVEAQACGTPVIAYGKGGTLETIRPLGAEDPSGIHFYEQTAQAIKDAVVKFENNLEQFTPHNCRNNSLRFGEERFRSELENYISEKWSLFEKNKQIKY